jgi:predicted ferric reductase
MNGAAAGRREPARIIRPLSWVCLYLLLVSAPVVVLLVAPGKPGTAWWWDLSMALGFVGLAIMGLQFALTARFRAAEAPFGIDIIYYFHRIVAVLGLALVLLHFVILWIGYPDALGDMHPLRAPAYMTAGRIALLLFIVLIVTSLWRKPLRIDYDHWRIAHALLATAALILAVLHIDGAGYYTEGPWKRPLWIGASLFWVLLIAHVRIVKPWLMLRHPYRVVGVLPEHGRTWTLSLAPEGHDGFRFQPGQFAWLTLRGRPFRFHEHPFSFSGSAEAQTLKFSIKALGDFTATIGNVRTGERAYLDGPYGVFTIDRYPDARGACFVAAGVGIAPIMSMLRTLADRGDRRPFTLLYANVSWDDVIFREELASLQQRLTLEIVHVLEHPPELWDGFTGRISEDLLRDRLPSPREDFEYFLCGPKPVCDAVQRWWRGMGVPLTRIHLELFDMV